MPLAKEFLILTYALGGITLKLADFYGEKGESYLRYVFAAASAICMGLLISDNPTSSSIVLGIVIGVILAGKLNQPNMVFGLCLTLVTTIVLGFTLPHIPLLAVVAVASVVDEVGHDRLAVRGCFASFFRFRVVLKATMVLLVVLMWVDGVDALGFFCFDLSYDVTDIALLRMEKGK